MTDDKSSYCVWLDFCLFVFRSSPDLEFTSFLEVKLSNTALDGVERNKGFPANSLFTVATFSINTALEHGGYASESLDTKSDIVIQLSVL